MLPFDESLRILHLAASHRWTGVAEPAATLAREQTLQGHQVAFACIEGSSFERHLREFGVTVAGGFRFDHNVSVSSYLRDIRTLRAYATRHNLDVVHCHLPNDHWIAVAAFRAPLGRWRKTGPAIVRTIHTDKPHRRDPLHRWLLGKKTDLVITVAESRRDELIEQIGLPPDRIRRVRGSVDLEKFHPSRSGETIRKLCEIPESACVAGLVARMRPNRGHHLLIETIEAVVAQVPQAMYLLAGRGEQKADLLDRIENHPLGNHLRRIGFRKFDLPETYAAMDVALMLAPGTDGSCRAMLEAMACGRPVIGSRRGAIRDTIRHGINGWLVEPNNREDLSAALIEALSDLERCRRMGEAARHHVERHHSREIQYRDTMESYGLALANCGLDRSGGLPRRPESASSPMDSDW